MFYVAITRTKKYLFLSYAKKRIVRGLIFVEKKSPFLDRLDQDLFDFSKEIYRKSHKFVNQLALFS